MKLKERDGAATPNVSAGSRLRGKEYSLVGLSVVCQPLAADKRCEASVDIPFTAIEDHLLHSIYVEEKGGLFD